jgi:hypothetical protein
MEKKANDSALFHHYLPEFESIEGKNKFFVDADPQGNLLIQSFGDFLDWYSDLSEENEKLKYKIYFRGVSEAKYKLYNTAQRTWRQNVIEDWNREPKPQLQYSDFVKRLIEKSFGESELLGKVFKIYGIDDIQKEFACLSILQHYGGPTPLIDWSYNLNVALLFAVDNIKITRTENLDDLDNYFSIYIIRDEELEIENIEEKKSLSDCFGLNNQIGHQNLLILSDILMQDKIFNPNKPFKDKLIATIYNQNIIPQEGLFIFNPDPNRSIEEMIPPKENRKKESKIEFLGVNINKRIAPYIKRKLANEGDNNALIYPNLRETSQSIFERVLNEIVKEGK